MAMIYITDNLLAAIRALVSLASMVATAVEDLCVSRENLQGILPFFISLP